MTKFEFTSLVKGAIIGFITAILPTFIVLNKINVVSYTLFSSSGICTDPSCYKNLIDILTHGQLPEFLILGLVGAIVGAVTGWLLERFD